jgi:Derlin-2/3
MMFLPALILALSYTVTQDQRGAKVNYMFVTMPAQLMPYAMLAINLLFPGGVSNMLLQLHGLFAGHLFDFLSRTWPQYGGGRNLIPTPAILSRMVQSAESILQRGFAGPGRPAGRTLGGGTGAAAPSGPLPDSWRTRGPGQRLG